MPKRARCTGCGTGMLHQKKYQIFEVIGVASGRTSIMIEQYCEECQATRGISESKREILNRIKHIRETVDWLTTGNVSHHRNAILGLLTSLRKGIIDKKLKYNTQSNENKKEE
ncbi:hypothetical protein LCGC14_3080990 [marine sediment metagenome]|uniref:YgiT-type zinc finger domain-containing protein n=1 Tax=marine sediment metagenome TaxID=412755 RepID=A0A0F8X1T6_9ZZZZ